MTPPSARRSRCPAGCATRRDRRAGRDRRASALTAALPEVRLLHGLVRHDRVGRVDREQAAVVHDGDSLREAGDHLHVVLDHQHRLALVDVHRADQLDELRHVLHRDARHRLVEQDHPRLAGEQHRQLELPLVAVREQAGRRRTASHRARRGRAPSSRVDRLARRGPRAARSASSRRAPPPPPAARSRARQQREHVRDLERAPDPRARAPERRPAGDVAPVELDGAATSAGAARR